MRTGAPVVRPSKTPLRISGRSGSRREVVPDRPARRRPRSPSRSAAASGSPAGQPSTRTPTAGPCDSPKISTRNIRPKLFMDPPSDGGQVLEEMGEGLGHALGPLDDDVRARPEAG